MLAGDEEDEEYRFIDGLEILTTVTNLTTLVYSAYGW